MTYSLISGLAPFATWLGALSAVAFAMWDSSQPRG